MKNGLILEPQVIEQTLINTIRTLHPQRMVQVLDFARWLQTQPNLDDIIDEELSEAELEAEDAAWELEYQANQEEFRAMARQALEEIESGETLGMVVKDGKIYPR